jgi:TonB family protein
VAKAFRIGANLVLTKPINVEQAKGTLRVARGLLRKNESAKPATTPPARPMLAAPAPAAGKPVLVTRASAPAVSAVSPGVAPSAPIQKPVTQPSFAATASSAGTKADESVKEAATPTTTSAAPEPKPTVTSNKVESVSPKAALSVMASSGAASAAAPAREAAASAVEQEKEKKIVEVIPEANVAVEKEAIAEESPEVEASAAPAPSFTFGGAVESGSKPASGGSKKALTAVAALVVIAAGSYFAWTQFGPSRETATVSAPVAARPAATAPVPQAAPSAVATTPDATSSVATSATATAVPTTEVQSSKAEKAASVPATSTTQAHVSKVSPIVDSGKTVVANNKVPPTSSEAAQPIVVKKGRAESASGKSEASDADAPSMTAVAATGDGGTMPNLLSGASGAPAPVLQVMNISQGVSQGLILKKVAPSYPSNALRLRTEGSVELLATISKKGDISSVKILSGDPNLARSAADAVKQWKYKPYLLDGSPVEIQTQVTVNFKLPR